MATNVQRSQAICDGMLNRVASQEQQLELAEALYDEAYSGKPYSELTNAEKAAIIPTYLLRYCKGMVRNLRNKKRPAIVDPDTDYNEGQ